MEYTVQKLSQIAGVSTRTLRYYDEIGILKPARINSSGYRIYGQKEVDYLQQILFYKALGVNLEGIKAIINGPEFDELKALRSHYDKLLKKRKELDQLIANVTKTIMSKERGLLMKDKDKFEGFIKKEIESNENRYGKESRAKYGDEAIDRSNTKLSKMTREDHERLNRLSDEVLETLEAAFKTGDPAGPLGQKTAKIHGEWLSFYWDKYTKEAHASLVQMYVDDERFTAYYDKICPGMTVFLRDAVKIYTGLE